MAENVNINVTENIDQVNIVASEVVEVVDLNLYATTEDVTINVTEEIIQVNINKVTASNVTKTSDLINDGEDGINPFITLEDIPPIDVSTLVPYTGATTNVDLGEFELKAGQLTLDTSPTGTAAVGTTRWNNTLGSSETTLKGGSVILKNGVDLVARVVNKVTPNTTLTKANYAAVRVSGAQGQRLAVAYAQANNDLNSTDTIGLVCETIPTNQEGFILTVGQLENINTTGSLQSETWADGDVIYLSPTVAGKLTNIKPTAPQHIVIIGYVEYAHANNGKLYVKIMNGWELEELHNVTSTNYTTPIDADSVLTYDSTNSVWKRLSWSNIKSNLKTYFDTIYQTALGFTPENVANKSTSTSLGTSDTLYPTQNAVKSYVDTGLNLKLTAPKFRQRNITKQTVSGTTALVELWKITIPANTFSSTDIIKIPFFRCTKTTSVGLFDMIIKMSTSSTIPSGTTDDIARFRSSAVNSLWLNVQRSAFIISGGNIEGFNKDVLNTYSDYLSSGSARTSKAFDTTVTNYLYFAVQPASASDTIIFEGAEATNL
jgi:nitrogen fixation protein